MKRLLALIAASLPWSCVPAMAAPQDAVVRVRIEMGGGKQAGGSATVIHTEPGRTLLLGCAHLYHGNTNAVHDILAPHHAPAGQHSGGPSRLVAVDANLDLSLVLMPVGPLPFVCPVAPQGTRPGPCLSVGYDNGALPPQVQPANIISAEPGIWLTREHPWHGRSGGALIDRATGQLVGVVSGYRSKLYGGRKVPTEGIYVSHAAVLQFLAKAGTIAAAPPEQMQAAPWTQPRRPYISEQRFPPQSFRPQYAQPPGC